MKKLSKLNAKKIATSVFNGTMIVGAVGGGIGMNALQNSQHIKAAHNKDIENLYEYKMDKETKEFMHFMTVLNELEVELPNDLTAEQVKEKYAEHISPTIMDKSKSENQKWAAPMQIINYGQGGIAGAFIASLIGAYGTGPLAAKGANKLNTLIANRRKEDEENTQEAQNTL